MQLKQVYDKHPFKFLDKIWVIMSEGSVLGDPRIWYYITTLDNKNREWYPSDTEVELVNTPTEHARNEVAGTDAMVKDEMSRELEKQMEDMSQIAESIVWGGPAPGSEEHLKMNGYMKEPVIKYHGIVPDAQWYENLEQIQMHLRTIQNRVNEEHYKTGPYNNVGIATMYIDTVATEINHMIIGIDNMINKGYYVNTKPTE